MSVQNSVKRSTINSQVPVTSPKQTLNPAQENYQMNPYVSSTQPQQQIVYQQTVVKREKADTTDLEVRVTMLTQEGYMWRKKYIDLQASSDRALNLGDTMVSLEDRIQVLLAENKFLNKSIKDKINENEKQRLTIQQLEVEIHQLNQYTFEVDRLHTQLQIKQGEINDLRARLQDQEASFLQYKTIEISLIESDNNNKGLFQQVQMWQGKYEKLQKDNQKLNDDMRNLQDQLTNANLGSQSRGSSNALQTELDRNKELMAALKSESDEWCKKALSLELELHDHKNRLFDQANRNNLLQAEGERLNQSNNFVEQEVSDIRLENQDLVARLTDNSILQTNLQNLQSLLGNKTSENDKLIKLTRLQDKDIKELKNNQETLFELEYELNYTRSEIDRLQEVLVDRDRGLDIIRQQNIKYEAKNGELKHQIFQMEIDQSEFAHSQSDLVFAQQDLLSVQQLNKELQDQINMQQKQTQEFKMGGFDKRRLQNTLEARDREVEDLRRRLTKMELKMKEMDGLEAKNFDLETNLTQINNSLNGVSDLMNENKLLMLRLQEEKDQLQQQLNGKSITDRELIKLRVDCQTLNQDLEQLKAKYDQSQKDIINLKKERASALDNSQFSEQQIKQFQEISVLNQRESEDFRTKCQKWEQEHFKVNKSLQDVNINNQQLSGDLDIQIEKQTSIQVESERLRLLVDSLKNELNEQDREYRSQLLSKTSEMQQQTIFTDQKQNEVNDLKLKYLKSEQLISELKAIEIGQGDINSRSQDVERHNQVINDELSQLRDHKSTLMTDIEQMGQDLQTSQNEIESLSKLKTTLQNVQKELMESKQQVPLLEQQIMDLKAQVITQTATTQQLQSDNSRILDQLQSKILQNNQLINKCNALEQSVLDLQSHELLNAQMEGTQTQLRDELNYFNEQQRDKNLEVNGLKETIIQLELALSGQQALQGEHSRMVRMIDMERKETEIMRSKAEQSQSDLLVSEQDKQAIQQKHQAIESDAQILEAKLNNQTKLLTDAVALQKQTDTQLEDHKQQIITMPIMKQNILIQQDELGTLKTQIQDLRIELEQSKIKANQQAKLISSIQPLADETKALREIVNQDQTQFLDFRSKIADLTETRGRDLDDFTNQRTQKDSELARANETAQKVPELESLLNQLDSNLKRSESNLTQAQDENDRLKQTIDALQIRIAGYESMEKDFVQLRDDLKNMQFQVDDLKLALSKAETQIEAFKSIKDNLEGRVVMLASEIERLNMMVSRKNDEIKNLNGQVARSDQIITELSPLQSDNRRQVETIEQQKEEIDEIKRRYHDKDMEADQLSKDKEGLENKLAMVSSEVERMQVKTNNRQNDISNLKLQLEDMGRSSKDLEDELKEQNLKINYLQNQNKDLDDLVFQLNQKSVEIGELKQKLTQLQSDLQTSKQAEHEVENLNLALKTKESENLILQQYHEQQQKKIEELEKVKYDYEGKISMLASEIERLTRKYQAGQNEVQNLKDQLNTANNDITRLMDEAKEMMDENKELFQSMKTQENVTAPVARSKF